MHGFAEKVHALKICIYVSAIWIMVMSSIRAKPCFIHMCSLRLHSYWLSHASHEFFCMVSACIGTILCMCMHALKACVYTHVSQSLGFLCTCLFVSRDERALHLLALTMGRVVCLHSFACTGAERSSVCGSRAEHLLALFKSCSVYLYSVSCAES